MASRDKNSAITAALEEIRRVMGERIDQGYDQSPRHGSRGHDEHEGRTRTYDVSELSRELSYCIVCRG